MFLHNYVSIILIDITISRYFALSTQILFIALMQSENGVELFNVTCLSHSPEFLAAASSPSPVIANYSKICKHPSSKKDLTLSLQSWTWFDIVLYVPCALPFTSTWHFVQNLDGWLFVLWSKLMTFSHTQQLMSPECSKHLVLSFSKMLVVWWTNKKIFCSHQFSPECSMNKFKTYISTGTCFLLIYTKTSVLVTLIIDLFVLVICMDPHK